MKRLYRFLVIMVLAAAGFTANAQNDGITFTLLPHVPYSNYLNPGIRVPYNAMIGVGFSNIGFNIYNSSLTYKNFITTNSNGDNVIDGVGILNSLKDTDNFINTNFSLDLLNVGFRVNKLFFNIDWRTRVNAEVTYAKDFVGLFVLGNNGYLGSDNPCNFNINMNATAFSEIGIGAQYDVNDKLTVGIRPKFLIGVANVTMKNDETKIYTDADTYAITADVHLDIQAASMLKSKISRISDVSNLFDVDSIGIANMFSITENIGLGVDFGASYTFNEHWGLAAGVYDLGYIKWKDTKEKRLHNDNVNVHSSVFTSLSDVTNMELDYSSMVGKVIDAVWGNDSLTPGSDYKTYLKTRIMLQGYYELNPMVRFTAIGQMYYIKDKMRPAITLAYSGEFWNRLDLTASFTAAKYSGYSLGLGFGFHAGPFNIYAVTDNILALTKVAAPTIEMATSYSAYNFRMGIVWTIGKYQGGNRLSKPVEKKQVIDTEAIDKEIEEFKERNSDVIDE